MTGLMSRLLGGSPRPSPLEVIDVFVADAIRVSCHPEGVITDLRRLGVTPDAGPFPVVHATTFLLFPLDLVLAKFFGAYAAPLRERMQKAFDKLLEPILMAAPQQDRRLAPEWLPSHFGLFAGVYRDAGGGSAGQRALGRLVVGLIQSEEDDEEQEYALATQMLSDLFNNALQNFKRTIPEKIKPHDLGITS